MKDFFLFRFFIIHYSLSIIFRLCRLHKQEEGLAEGIEKGLAKGILAVARRMKELGLPIEQISNATNLPTDQIEKL